jgi:hypothetical protein
VSCSISRGSFKLFNKISGIALSVAGLDLFVSDYYPASGLIHRIALNSNNEVTVFAGTISSPYRDGIGLSAGFAGTNGIAASPSGELYVADTSYIRRISEKGKVTTIFGLSHTPEMSALAPAIAFHGPTNRVYSAYVMQVNGQDVVTYFTVQEPRATTVSTSAAFSSPGPSARPTTHCPARC